MNILYLTNHLNVGGITSYVLSLAAGLAKRGHRIFIASSGGALLSRFQAEGAIFIPIPISTKKEMSPRILMSGFKLRKELGANAIDIIHSNSRTTGVLGCLLSKVSGIAHISTCHGFFKNRPLRRLFPCWGHKIIAVSQQVKEHLINDFQVDAARIAVINNGIDISQYGVQVPSAEGVDCRLPPAAGTVDREELKKGFGLKEGPVVGIVARLSDVKGHVYLIEAMRKVIDKIPHAQLLIVGEGRMERELKKLTERLKIQNSVVFLPSVGQTQKVLSVMDVFVMPSLKEGLGLALMEAMAAGLAVIGSDVGGIKSLIQDKYNGLFVLPADSASLSVSIAELLSDAEKRNYLGNNARDFIRKNFSLEEMVGHTERVYRECSGAN